MDSKLLAALANLDKLAALAGDLEGRKDGTQFATTTDLTDPLELRRVRTTTADKGALASHDYAMRSLPCPYWDPPVPIIGMALTLANFDGNPHDQVYDGVMVNAANPPFAKTDPINDDWRRIPGISTLEVGKAWTVTIGETWRVTSEEDASLVSEQKMTIEGAGGKIEITASGDINITCTGKVKIGGKEVAVVGAVDSAGHPLVNSGQ